MSGERAGLSLPILLLATVSCGGAAGPRGETATTAGTAGAAKVIRVYVSGESIERRNRFVEAPFTTSGGLNERGGGDARNDNDEYGWMVPLRDRLALRDRGLSIQFVGTDTWLGSDDDPYTGIYPSTTAEPTSAISGTSIPAWLEQRRGELTGKTHCYDVAFASRGGNDTGTDDAEYRGQLKELVRLLAAGSSCRSDPVVYVTAHMPDDQRSPGVSDTDTVAFERRVFLERVQTAVQELAAESPQLKVRLVDVFTPFLQNRATTAFPNEVWATNGVFDYDKIGRIGDGNHPRRLASIYAGEVAADSLDLAELNALP
jgi:hypothetical protein